MIELGGNSACNGLDGLVRVQILFGFHMGRLKIKDNLLYYTCEGIGNLFFVSEIDYTAVVATNIHSGIGRESYRHGLIHPTFTDLLAVGPQGHFAAGTRLGLIGFEQKLDRYITGRERLIRDLPVYLHTQERIGMAEQTLLIDPQRETSHEVTVGYDDAFGAICRNLQISLDGV